MKLLYITNGINGAGGLERVLSVKASILAEEYNHEIHVLVLNDSHQDPFYEFSSKINFHSIDVAGNPLNYLISYKNGIQEMVWRINPDVISVCDDGLKGLFLPMLIKFDSKWIYERHVSKLIELNADHNFLEKLFVKVKWFLMEKLGKRFSKFIVLTEGNKKEWTSLSNLIVIPNPLSILPDRAAVLENKIVICVGKMSYQKGQDLLIEAWKIVHNEYPEWQLHLYGKENLEFLNTKQLLNNIHYFYPLKEIEKKYLESSISVMSSRFEGFGMVLIEAMTCGVPCVSFNCDYGPSDVIENNKNGFIVEKEDIGQLAEKLKILIKNIDLRRKLGQQAKKDVQKYHPNFIAKKWDDLLKELLQ